MSGGGLFVWKDGEDAAPTLYDINGVPLYFDGKNHFLLRRALGRRP